MVRITKKKIMETEFAIEIKDILSKAYPRYDIERDGNLILIGKDKPVGHTELKITYKRHNSTKV